MCCTLQTIGTAQKVLTVVQWARESGRRHNYERGSIRSLTHMGLMRRGGNVTKFL